MKLFAPTVHVPLDEGFTAEKDVFQRKAFGQTLFSVIGDAGEPFVVAIDAPWGEGKTTFARMWTGHINQNDGVAIYLDAFESDYLADPFVALASRVYELIDKEQPEKKQQFLKLAKRSGRVVARIGFKALTGIVLDGSVVDDAGVVDEISDEGAAAIDKALEKRITGAAEDRNTLAAFKNFLEIYAKESGSEHPLIFIIDELDRCRPNYALEMLETVKHLFSVPNVVFVLVVNRQQLEESIRSQYGTGIDANKYLQKYVSIWASLPVGRNVRNSQRSEYVYHCIEAMRGGRTDQFARACGELLTELADHFNSSLREIERYMTNVAIVANATSGDVNKDYTDITVIVSVLKVTNPKLYVRMRIGKATYEELLKETNFDKLEDSGWANRPEGSYVRFLLKFYTSSRDEQQQLLEECKDYFHPDARSGEDPISVVCGWLDSFSRR